MKPQQTIAELAADANEWYLKAVDAMRVASQAAQSAVVAAKNCGDALNRAKRRLRKQSGHGNWESWLDANFAASKETAQHYMRISTYWRFIEKRITDEPNLSINSALHLIRKSKKFPDIADECIWANENTVQYRSEMKRMRRLVESDIRSNLKQWDDYEIAMLAQFRMTSGVPWLLEQIRREISPIAEVLMDAEAKRLAAVRNGMADECAYGEFLADVTGAFTDRDVLTPYVRELLETFDAQYRATAFDISR